MGLDNFSSFPNSSLKSEAPVSPIVKVSRMDVMTQ